MVKKPKGCTYGSRRMDQFWSIYAQSQLIRVVADEEKKLQLISMFLVTGMDDCQCLFQRNNVRGNLGSRGSLRCLSQLSP